ncbi:MAG TPA: hypothetical protein VGK96_20055 [Candidatus Sulfotelmatobacter sp.]
MNSVRPGIVAADQETGGAVADRDAAEALFISDWNHNHPAGRGADTLPGGKRLFPPLRTGSAVILLQ